MPRTEDGLAVPAGARGVTTPGDDAAVGRENPNAQPPLTEDGFVPRNSGRPDLYPHAPMHYRGPQKPATGRLDEVTAAPAPEPEAAPAAPPGLQVPRSPLPPALKPQAPAATE